MRLIAALLICLACSQSALWAQNQSNRLPESARMLLNRRLPGWKFTEVSQEVRQFFETEMTGQSPHLIGGDFDGNGKRDYAVLISHGQVRYGEQTWPRSLLVVFLRKAEGYRMYIIKEPNGEYLCLARKGEKDFNYDEQREITYANDAILTGIFEKGGSSYVFEKGRFRTFVSSD
jgi:hypothetical protein